MSSPHLIEYRCPCGKLLFKGLLFSSVVEVKCRRCGSFSMWTPGERTPWAMIECDASGCVVRAYGDVLQVFGRSEEELLGQDATSVLSLPSKKADAEEGTAAPRTGAREAYELYSSTLTLADGKPRAIRSCILSRMNEGKFDGYRIYSMPAEGK